MIFVIGCDGYIGHALTLKLLEEDYDVLGIDNFSRRKFVEEMGSVSATNIDDEGRYIHLSSYSNFNFINLDIEKNRDALFKLFKKYKPRVVVNLAQQPSAPFSHRSVNHTINTTTNNLVGTINVLYAMGAYVSDAQLIQIGSMGEYDHSIDVNIAEGIFEFEYKNRRSKKSIFPRRPGSFYHASKVASTYYIDCACRWWGLRATDIMQGIVYGVWTPETEKHNLLTRLDSDEAFGTVIHRFVIQSIIGSDLTIYGDGLHKRGFIALNDSIQCLMLAIKNKIDKGTYRTWNQLDTVHSMNDIADTVIKISKNYRIETNKKYIESPRKEFICDHYYNPEVNNLKELGFSPSRKLEEEINYIFRTLVPYKDKLKKLKKVVNPIIRW